MKNKILLILSIAIIFAIGLWQFSSAMVNNPLGRVDSSNNLLVSNATLQAGEDITNDVQKVEQRFSYSNISADTSVKSSAGFIHTLTFAQIDAAPTAGTIIVYDNTAESGTVIFSSTWTTAVFSPVTITIDSSFSTGFYVGFSTTTDIGVTISYR